MSRARSAASTAPASALSPSARIEVFFCVTIVTAPRFFSATHCFFVTYWTTQLVMVCVTLVSPARLLRHPDRRLRHPHVCCVTTHLLEKPCVMGRVTQGDDGDANLPTHSRDALFSNNALYPAWTLCCILGARRRRPHPGHRKQPL